MSWLYSRALVEAFSEGGCSAGEPSAPSSGSPTPQAYLPPDRMTAFSRPSRFGMTFAPLTDDHGAAVLTSFLAAFPAKTSASQAKAPALTEPDQACGPTWRVSLARFSPATSSWKTAQRSLLGDSDESSVIWPRSGMTADGQCWELPTLGQTISGTDSGLWPTPTVCGNYNRKGASPTSGDGLATVVKNWPTPNARDYKGAPGAGCQARGGHQSSLSSAVRMFHTPTTGGLDGGSNSRRAAEKRGEAMPGGGSLNPTWVEWLMGWPLGWTDLKPLATDRCHFAQQPHGGF
jgi:hypothetical protein